MVILGGLPPKCRACEKSVYVVEQAIGPGNTVYHKSCLKCMACRKTLDARSLVDHEDEPYCKMCHTRNFGPMGPARFAATPSPPKSQASTTPATTPATTPSPSQRKPALSPSPVAMKFAQNAASVADYCPTCSQRVYFAEKVQALGKAWHRGCLKCTKCRGTLAAGSLDERDGAPFCRKCYQVNFGTVASGILHKPGFS